MTRDQIESTKRRADQLVESYGAFRLASRFEEAIDQLSEIWQLDPVDLQIFLPSKSLATSNGFRKVTALLGGGSKDVAKASFALEAAAVAKTKGNLAAKTASAVGKVKTARETAGSATKVGLSYVKTNKKVAIAAGTVTATAALGIGFTLKKELRTFNDKCYKHHLEKIILSE